MGLRFGNCISFWIRTRIIAMLQKKLEEAQAKQKALVQQYEAKYGPINETSHTANRWAWVSGPWPWEQEANE